MTTLTGNSNGMAAARYEQAHFEVAGIIETLRDRLFDMPATGSDSVTWSNVADLQKIQYDLEEVLRFVNSSLNAQKR